MNGEDTIATAWKPQELARNTALQEGRKRSSRAGGLTVIGIKAGARVVAQRVVDEVVLGRELPTVADLVGQGEESAALALAELIAQAYGHELARRVLRRHGRREAANVGGLGDGAGAEEGEGSEGLHFRVRGRKSGWKNG